MVRGYYEIRKETEKRIMDMMRHATEGSVFFVSKWHASYKVIDKKIIACDEYSLNLLKEFTSEEWRAEHAHKGIHQSNKIDFFR